MSLSAHTLLMHQKHLHYMSLLFHHHHYATTHVSITQPAVKHHRHSTTLPLTGTQSDDVIFQIQDLISPAEWEWNTWAEEPFRRTDGTPKPTDKHSDCENIPFQSLILPTDGVLRSPTGNPLWWYCSAWIRQGKTMMAHIQSRGSLTQKPFSTVRHR